MATDDHGAYLQIVDKKANVVSVNYQAYSGATRNIIKAMDQVIEKNDFVIDWEKPVDKVYLADHDFLIGMLRRSTKLVDIQFKKISFAENAGKLVLEISLKETDGKLAEQQSYKDCIIKLIHQADVYTDFEVITEDMILCENELIEIPPLGNGFVNLSHFNTEINAKTELVFLCLFYSYLENIALNYDNFEIVKSEESIYVQPALIFEKVDVDESLYLRVGQTLPQLDIDTLNRFDLIRYPEINELERKITVKYIEQKPVEEVISTIQKLLKKHTPPKRKNPTLDVIKEDNLFIIPAAISGPFILNELAGLLLDYQIYGAEKLKSYKVSTQTPKINVALSHGIDFLEGEVNLEFGSQQIDLFDALSQLRKNNYVKLSDGTRALVNKSYFQKLERLFKKKSKKKVALSFFDLPMVEELIADKVKDDTFKKSRAVFDGFNDIAKSKFVKPKVKAKLRPYQQYGYKWLKYLRTQKLGGCLADDMGLGKTLQALCVLVDQYPKTKELSLVVMPKSLLFNWAAEVDKFAPTLKHHTYYGTARNLKTAKKAQVIFTTYATMRNDIEKLKEIDWHYVILDESQNIKNIQTQTTKAVMLLNAKHRLALSGTPIENNLGELYSLFRFLNPGMFGSLQNFSQHYISPIQKENDPEAIAHLRRKIYPFILRRLKKNVLKDLPDKIEQTLFVEMSERQHKLYTERRLFYQALIENQISEKGVKGSTFAIFQALNELRQIATIPEKFSDGNILSPKRELLQEQLFDTIANGHKVLIFVNFLAAIELIGEQLSEMGVDFVSMTGATRDRQRLVNKFQNEASCKVFLMTLKTGGTGLNLTAADTIFIFDPWWNVAAEHQAIDRAHRMGQQNKVLAYKLIAKDSIEEKIMQLQEKKKALFDNIIAADGASLKSLSKEDINFIFS